MWFKNLQMYRLPSPWTITLAQLEEQLARGPFVKCPSTQAASRGWVSPRGDGSMVFSIGRQWMIALTNEHRLLPSSVVNDEVKERAEAMEAQQGYAPGRKQMRELKERVIEELMPRAFTRQRTTYSWIDPVAGWLVIDASSAPKAEEVIEHMRVCLDEFPLALPKTRISPQSAMADWLAGGNAPTGFTIDRDCELKACGEEKAAVAYKRHTLDGDQVREHLAAGKLPTKLALTWDDRISFMLTERMEIKRLAFLDLLKGQAEQDAEHAEEQFDADFALMTGELARFIPQLVAALGGEVVELSDQGGGAPAPARQDGDSEEDYHNAVAIVKSSGRASISLVQRHLRIGYNYAARLLERMEADGIVSAMDQRGTRTVIVSGEHSES